MKLYRKPISSPIQTDKFPPPLMRFWCSNVRRRRRSRSNSIPITMILRKKNSNIETNQEPTSPKVTCMGEIRVKRSSKSKQQKISTRAAAKHGAPIQCRWSWFRKNAFKIKPCHSKPTWPKWGFIFKVGIFRRKPRKMKEGSTKTELEVEHESERVMNGDDASSFASNSGTPPRNALSLTRCRSKPYRSSSLASRFWGSSLRNEERTEKKQGNEIENEIPHLKRNSVSVDEGKRVSKNEEKLNFFTEIEDSLRYRFASMKITAENVDEWKKREKEEGDREVPLHVVLTSYKVQI